MMFMDDQTAKTLVQADYNERMDEYTAQAQAQQTEQIKIQQLEQAKASKIALLGAKKDTLVGMQDADTFALKNAGAVRADAGTQRYDAVELQHGTAPYDMYGVKNKQTNDYTKSSSAMTNQRKQVAALVGKSIDQVTQQDMIDVGNMQQIQMLADVARSPGEDRWAAPLIKGVTQANLTGKYKNEFGQNVTIPLNVEVMHKDTGTAGNRGLGQVGSIDGTDAIATAAQDKRLNASLYYDGPKTTQTQAPVNPVAVATTQEALDKVKEALKQRESRGNYQVVNQYGYTGAYQFGATALAQMGLVKQGTTNKGMENPANWTGKYGMTSVEKFKNSPEVQDGVMDKWLGYLASEVADGSKSMEDFAGKVAAAHLLGVAGAKDLNAVDANKTSGHAYYKLGAEAVGSKSRTAPEMGFADRAANAVKGFGYTLADQLSNLVDLPMEAYEKITTGKDWIDAKGQYDKVEQQQLMDAIGYDNRFSQEAGEQAVTAIKNAIDKGDYYGVMSAIGKGAMTPELVAESMGYVVGLIAPGGAAKAVVRGISGVNKAAKAMVTSGKAKNMASAVAMVEKTKGTPYKMANLFVGNIGYANGAEQFARDAEELYKNTYNTEMPDAQRVAARLLGMAYVKMDAGVAKAIVMGKDPIAKLVPEMMKQLPKQMQTTMVGKIASKAGLGAARVAGVMAVEGGTEMIQTGMEKLAGKYNSDMANNGKWDMSDVYDIGAAGVLGASGGVQMAGPNIAKGLVTGYKTPAEEGVKPVATPAVNVDAIRARGKELQTKMSADEQIDVADLRELADLYNQLPEGPVRAGMTQLHEVARDKYLAGLASGKGTDKVLGSRMELMYMLDDVGNNVSPAVDKQMFMLASRSGLLGKGDTESQAKVYAKIKKDFATVSDEALIGKRGSVTHFRELDALLNATVPDLQKISKKVEEIKKFEATQPAYVEALTKRMDEIDKEIATVNAQLKKNPEAALAKALKDKVIATYKNKDVAYGDKKATFRFHIEENADGTLSLRTRADVAKTFSAKLANAKFMREELQNRAAKLQQLGLVDEALAVGSSPIIDEAKLAKFGTAGKTAVDKVEKLNKRVAGTEGTVKFATMINEGGFTEALLSDNKELINNTSFTANDILYVILDAPKTGEDVKKIYKAVQKGGALHKVLLAAKKAGATIEIDKSLAMNKLKTKVMRYKDEKGKVHTKDKTALELIVSSMRFNIQVEGTEPLTIKEIKEGAAKAKAKTTSYKSIGASEGKNRKLVFKPAGVVDANRVKTKEAVKAKLVKEAIVDKHYKNWTMGKFDEATHKAELLANLDNKDSLPDDGLIDKVFGGRLKSRVAKIVELLKSADKLTDDMAKAAVLDDINTEYTKEEITKAEEVIAARAKTAGTLKTGYVDELQKYLKDYPDATEEEIATRKEELLNELYDTLSVEEKDRNMVQKILDNSISKGIADLFLRRKKENIKDAADNITGTKLGAWGPDQSKGERDYGKTSQIRKMVNDITKFIKVNKADGLLTALPVDVLLGEDKTEYISNMVNWLKDNQKIGADTAIGGSNNVTYSQRMLDLKTSPALGLVLDKDGNVNKTVAFAMQLAIDEYIKINSSMLNPEYKSKEDVAKMFGVLEAQVTKEMSKLVKERGVHNKTIANDVGKGTLKRLGIVFDKENAKASDAELELFNKLIADIGHMAVLSMLHNGVLDDSSVTKGKEVVSQVTVEEYAKALDKNATVDPKIANESLWFIRLNKPKNKKLKEVVDNVTAEYTTIAELIDDKNTYEKKYHTRKIDVSKSRHVKEQVSKDIVGLKIPTGSNGGLKSADEFIKRLVDTKWKVDTENVDTLLAMYNDTTAGGREVMLGYLGYVTDEQLAKMTVEGRAAAEAQNRDTLKSIEELQKMADSGDYKNDVWFDWFYSINGRYMMDSNTINPQTDKLHRFLVQPASHTKTYIKTKDGVKLQSTGKAGDKTQEELDKEAEKMTMLFDYALAQAFGFKVDKKKTASVREVGKALRNLSKKQLDQLEKEFKEGKEKWHIPGTEIEIEVEHLSHTLQALSTLRKLSTTKVGSTFTSALTAEFDAVTSGFGLKLLQFPIIGETIEKLWEWLAKVGVFSEATFAQYVAGVEPSMNDILDNKGKLLDSYQTLSSDVKLADVKDKLDNKQMLLWNSLDTNGLIKKAKEGENISSALRSLFKDPFMTFNYSAGITAIKRSLAYKLTNEVLEGIAQEKAEYADIANELAKLVGVDAQELIKKLRNDPISKIKTKMKVILGKSKYANEVSIEDYLVDMYTKTYGAEVETIMKNQFGEFMQANDAINGAFRIMFDVFKAEYAEAKAKVPTGKWNEEVFNTIMHGDGTKENPGLLQKFPLIRGPLTKDGAIDEGVGIYKLSSQMPNIDNVRYEPAQTTTGIEDGAYKRNVAHVIKDFEAAISAGSVVPIHYIDGALMAQLADYDVTAIHDAIMPELDKSVDAITKYNKSMLDIATKYRLLDAVVEMLDRLGDTDVNKVSTSKIRIWVDGTGDMKGKMVEAYTNDEKKGENEKITNSRVIENVKKLQTKVTAAWKDVKDNIVAIGHMAGVPGSMWTREKLGAGDIYSQTDMGVTKEELSAIDKANKKFMTANPQIKLVIGDTFSYENNVITLDKDADEADRIVYMAHEIVHAKTAEWMSKDSNKGMVNKLKETITEVLGKIGKLPLKDMTEEVALLKDRLEWANGKDDNDYTRTVENVAILAAEPAMRRVLLELLPTEKRGLVDRILDKVKEWLGKELPMDGQRILKLVDRMVVKAEKETKVDTISNKKEIADEKLTGANVEKDTILTEKSKQEALDAIPDEGCK